MGWAAVLPGREHSWRQGPRSPAPLSRACAVAGSWSLGASAVAAQSPSAKMVPPLPATCRDPSTSSPRRAVCASAGSCSRSAATSGCGAMPAAHTQVPNSSVLTSPLTVSLIVITPSSMRCTPVCSSVWMPLHGSVAGGGGDGVVCGKEGRGWRGQAGASSLIPACCACAACLMPSPTNAACAW